MPIAVRDGTHASARRDMALASLFSGLGLANAGLGAVHGYAGPLGGMIDIPHGAACAILLAPCMKHNADAALASGNTTLLDRLGELAWMLTGQTGGPNEVVDWAFRISSEVGIGKLSDYGFKEADIPGLIPKVQNASSMKGNPVELSCEALETILKEAL